MLPLFCGRVDLFRSFLAFTEINDVGTNKAKHGPRNRLVSVWKRFDTACFLSVTSPSSNAVVIGVTKEGISFSTGGDIGKANVVCRQSSSVEKVRCLPSPSACQLLLEPLSTCTKDLVCCACAERPDLVLTVDNWMVEQRCLFVQMLGSSFAFTWVLQKS